GEHLATVGPVRIVVGEVGFPHQLVDPDQIAVDDGVAVGDHADPEVLREHFGGQPAALDAFVAAAQPGVVEALEHVRHPTGPAHRSISRTASRVSHNGISVWGMNRSGYAAHHSSSIQLFHASRHASARSLSTASRKRLPPKRGNVGNNSSVQTPSSSIVRTRSWTSYAAGIMSS